MSGGEEARHGQVTGSAAEIYEAYFVPALFQEWAHRVVAAAQVRPGQRVLDVGCGTGVLAREVARRTGPDGSVVGLDANEDMLAVAATRYAGVDWRLGSAEALPFESASFDAVVSQFMLMFVPEPAAAVAEMKRVSKPRGRVAFAVWDTLGNTPAYAAVRDLLHDLFGDAAAAAMEPPFALGDVTLLRSICAEAGLDRPRIETQAATAAFPSIRSWMHTEIRGWTLADSIDDEGFEVLAGAAETELERFRRDDGTVEFAVRAHIVTC